MLLCHITSDKNRRKKPLPHLYYDNMHTVSHLFWHLDHTDVGDKHSLEASLRSRSTQAIVTEAERWERIKKPNKENTAGEAGSPNISLFIPSDCRAPSLHMSSSSSAAAGSQRARRSSLRTRAPGPPAAGWTCRQDRGTPRDPRCPRRPGWRSGHSRGRSTGVRRRGALAGPRRWCSTGSGAGRAPGTGSLLASCSPGYRPGWSRAWWATCWRGGVEVSIGGLQDFDIQD